MIENKYIICDIGLCDRIWCKKFRKNCSKAPVTFDLHGIRFTIKLLTSCSSGGRIRTQFDTLFAPKACLWLDAYNVTIRYICALRVPPSCDRNYATFVIITQLIAITNSAPQFNIVHVDISCDTWKGINRSIMDRDISRIHTRIVPFRLLQTFLCIISERDIGFRSNSNWKFQQMIIFQKFFD